MKNGINYEIAAQMMKEMPESKKEVLRKALTRNLILTSSRVMSFGKMTIYKEGWYLELEGTRCSFSVFAKDNDGEFQFCRKPVERLLNKIYDETLYFNEGDFDNI